MFFIPYFAIIFASGGNALKQFAMKNCGKRAPGVFNSICVNLGRVLICSAVSLVFWIATGGGGTNALGYTFAILGGIGSGLGCFVWMLAASLVPMSLIEIFSTFGSLVIPMILAPYIFDGDSVSLIQWGGCALLILSVFAFVKPKGRKNGEGEIKKNGAAVKVLLIFFQMLAVVMSTVFQKCYNFHIASKGLGTMECFNLVSFCVMVAVYFLAVALFATLGRDRVERDGGRIVLPYKQVWKLIVLAGVGLYISQYCLGIASRLPSAVYFPLYQSAVMIETFLLDTLVFKDKFTVRRLIGIMLVIAAVVLVNV